MSLTVYSGQNRKIFTRHLCLTLCSE